MSCWQSLKCLRRSELRLEITLKCGQSFRWSRDQESGDWIGVLRGKLWRLRQSDQQEDQILFQTVPVSLPKDRDRDEEILKDYFQLGVKSGRAGWISFLPLPKLTSDEPRFWPLLKQSHCYF